MIMLASEALSITNRNMYKTDAIEYGIKNLEEKHNDKFTINEFF